MKDLRYHEVSIKASHNSYERNERIVEQIDLNTYNGYDCGCRGIELDISQSDENNRWSVGHEKHYNATRKQLSAYLAELADWSDDNPHHDVITLHLDIKHASECNFIDGIDSYLKLHFPVDIYCPLELFGSCDNLSQGALNNNWPTLGELNGKFIVCITGESVYKDAYAKTFPKKRLCFADKDMASTEMPNDDHRVFFNYHILDKEHRSWMAVFKKSANKQNMVVRAWVANTESDWNHCILSGCNIIATDKISHHFWAKIP